METQFIEYKYLAQQLHQVYLEEYIEEFIHAFLVNYNLFNIKDRERFSHLVTFYMALSKT